MHVVQDIISRDSVKIILWRTLKVYSLLNCVERQDIKRRYAHDRYNKAFDRDETCNKIFFVNVPVNHHCVAYAPLYDSMAIF